MQNAAGAAMRRRENVLLLSPTGSGKTLAFLLPTMDLISASSDELQGIVMVPGRELALQIEDVFRHLACDLRIVSLFGGRPVGDEARRMRELRPQIVVSTPGRLLDHLSKGNLSRGNIQLLIIDEYDKCLDLGFRDEIDRIGYLLLPIQQVVVSSATSLPEMSSDEGNLPLFLKGRQFSEINFLDRDQLLNERLQLEIVHSQEKDKLLTLLRLLSLLEGEQCIVFVAHRESADRVGAYLHKENMPSVVYHGGLEQEVRERALYRFRAGAATILVSTDLAARGLDIPDVGTVIHYHLPQDEATFAHRSGRTARWQANGRVYLIVSAEEHLPSFVENGKCGTLKTRYVDQVSIRTFQPVWTVLYIGRGKRDKLSKADILGFLCKKGGLRADQIGRIDVTSRAAYVAVMRQTLKSLTARVAGEKIKGMKTRIEEMKV